jgi:tetratricopeptide (TPR) repeat protein
MSEVNSNQTLMALLALKADDSIATDNAAALSDGAVTPRPPTLDQRTDMFLRAVYGPSHPVTAETRLAVRKRLIGAMAADLADENIGPASAPVDPTDLRLRADDSAAQPMPSVSLGLSQLWSSLLQYCQKLLPPPEAFALGGLRMAAVPLVALLIVGSVWTTGWIDEGSYWPANQNFGPSSGPNQTSPISRSRGLLEAQSDNSQAEQNLRRDIAATEAALGPAHPVLAGKLVDLASLLRAEGRYAEAEALCTRALTIDRRTLGPRDPETVRTIKELAMIYRAQGRSKEADDLLARADQP